MRSLFAPWLGGASAGATEGGVRSLFAFWAGGASSVTPTVSGGRRSLLAFWIGGAAGTSAAYGSPGREDYQLAWERRQRSIRDLRRDDDEVLLIIGAFLVAGGE